MSITRKMKLRAATDLLRFKYGKTIFIQQIGNNRLIHKKAGNKWDRTKRKEKLAYAVCI
jgi:hypothetical protein